MLQERMTDRFSSFRRVIREEIKKISSPQVREIEEQFKQEIESLCDGGVIGLGDDYSLSGDNLEYRVKQLLRGIGFEPEKGRKGMEDVVVPPPSGLSPGIPLVLEIKSSRQAEMSRDDLRQLDDWVFDLSGEEQARKEGLGGGLDHLAMVTDGLTTSRQHHPSPHKGVMVFNGPINVPFTKRTVKCLSGDKEQFALKRNFCVIAFRDFISFFGSNLSAESKRELFWRNVHSVAGFLDLENLSEG